MAPSGFRTRRHSASQRPREAVVVGKARELVPGVVDAVDHRVVGAKQLPFQLQIVGRVGEHEIDALVGEPGQLLQAIADEDAVGRDGTRQSNSQPFRGALTQGHGRNSRYNYTSRRQRPRRSLAPLVARRVAERTRSALMPQVRFASRAPALRPVRGDTPRAPRFLYDKKRVVWRVSRQRGAGLAPLAKRSTPATPTAPAPPQAAHRRPCRRARRSCDRPC